MTSSHFQTQIAAWWDWLSDQVGGEGASAVEKSFLDDCQNAALHMAELESKLDSTEASLGLYKMEYENEVECNARQADQIKDLSSRLQECQKYWDDEKRRYDAADKGFRLVCDERDSLSRRLGEIEKHRDGLSRDLIEAIEDGKRLRGALEEIRDHKEETCAAYEEWARELVYDLLGSAVEKHERICGVPDPDDECEECIRPLGHDGEHDFSTPPE